MSTWDDDDLLDTMRSEFAHVKLGASMDDVVARGRRLRRRRAWSALGAGTGSVAAVIALTFSLAGPNALSGNPTHVTLAAWSVTVGPRGTVKLTIRNLREARHDQARLREALRAAGVPDVVQTGLARGCRPTETIQQGIVLRHAGTITFKIEPGKLPKGAQGALLIPTIEVQQSARSGRPTVIVRLAPAAERQLRHLRQRHTAGQDRAGKRRLAIVVLGPVCVPTATSTGPGG